MALFPNALKISAQAFSLEESLKTGIPQEKSERALLLTEHLHLFIHKASLLGHQVVACA